MCKFFTTLFLITGVMVIPAFGQNGYILSLSGPEVVCPGSTHSYTPVWEFAGSPASPPVGGTVKWTVYSGTVYTSGSTYALIGWASGDGFILYEYTANGTYYYATLNVTLNCIASLTTPPDPVPDPECLYDPGSRLTSETGTDQPVTMSR